MPIINTVIQGGGTTPTGTKYITSNGTHDVAAYEYADVQVPTTAPEIYRVFRSNDGKLDNSITTPFLPLPNTITDVGNYCLYGAYMATPSSVLSGAIDLGSLTTVSGSSACVNMFDNCTGITSVDLSSLTTVSGGNSCQRMFLECTNLTSVDLSSLTTISGGSSCQYMFSVCTGITSVDLSSLTTISGSSSCQYMFSGCTGITSVDLSSLTTVSGASACQYMFSGCTGITSVDFSSLTTVSGDKAFSYLFQNCTGLTRVSFYALDTNSFGSRTNQFNRMLNNVTGCTVHFPMRVQSTIGSWSDVTNGFGGTNTTVLFDIVTSLTGADSNTYTRQQKDSTSTATAWTYNSILYYTSGTTEPAVGDTIYSDSACTTAVTTISSIA